MAIAEDYPYRVFVSYAREDTGDALKLVAKLKELRLQPVWDRKNRIGWPFVNEIQNQIAHSHLFIPLITPGSVDSSWVNNEIGYAMGRSIPVLPLGMGALPEGMPAGIEARQGDNIEDVLRQLRRTDINSLVDNARMETAAQCLSSRTMWTREQTRSFKTAPKSYRSLPTLSSLLGIELHSDHLLFPRIQTILS